MSQTEEQQPPEQPEQTETPQPSETSSPSPDVPPPHPRGPDGKFRPKGLPEDESWDYVELSPEAQKRFNRVYGALKHHQALGEQLLNDNVLLADRLEKLEKRVTSTQEASTDAQLKGAKAAALAAGDYQRVVEIDDALLELKAKSLQQTMVQPIGLSETPAVQNYQLDETSRVLLDQWGSERGADGHLLRPWVDERHPLHQKAQQAHRLVMADPTTAFAPIGDVLDAIDGYMGIDRQQRTVGVPQAPPQPPAAAAKPARHAAFLGTENPPKSKVPSPQLTAQQIHIAKRMFRGDPDPIARYRRAIATHG